MDRQIRLHYASDNLAQRIFKALEDAGKNLSELGLEDYARVDQLHTGGAMATTGLVTSAGFSAGARILDAGCGLGGSSRLLARDYGHLVTGVDLSGTLIQAAKDLTRQVCLEKAPLFLQSSVADLPFKARLFDGVLCQHILMNIPDKQSAVQELCRVLKDGGKLVLHEIVSGENEMMCFPVPWAQGPEISHLQSWNTIETLLTDAGCRPIMVSDETAQAAAWWARVKKAANSSGRPPSKLGPALVFGENAAQFGKTMSANIGQGAIQIFKAVFKKTASC